MANYLISCSNPEKHYITVRIQTTINKQSSINFQLPSWRPGRYELANYAQNIKEFHAYNEKNEILPSKKITKDCWEINCADSQEIILIYSYYACQLDAGASYYDDKQLYVNPVNCLGYFEGQIEDKCQLKLSIPNNYKIASALVFDKNNEAIAQNFHQLADSPFIASDTLMHEEYKIESFNFHIWIQGKANPNWAKIIQDFTKFSQAQINIYGELPCKEYHFLFQLPNHKFYHGVEHLDSTVICLGPGYRLMDKDIYAEFLGVSSHELFHSWNIKSIRPIEMFPYDYTKENYSNLGYVAEGVTTYYGDLMLLRSGVFTFEEYALEFCKTYQKHMQMFGRNYMDLAQSSFDTWLDGYKPGVPDRKISMYFKGMIVALMTDISLFRDTKNQYGLDEIMRLLYLKFAKAHKGYTEQDYLDLVSGIAQRNYNTFFKDFIWGVEPLEAYLEACLDYIGCQINEVFSHELYESKFGFKIKEENTKCVVVQIAPESPADKNTLMLNDEIIAINGMQCEKNNLNDLLRFHGDQISLSIFRSKELIEVNLKAGTERFFPNYILSKKSNANHLQKENFEIWSKNKFEA